MRLITPRTTRQLLARYGLAWREALPPGTVYAHGENGDGIRVLYWWTPVGTDAQARKLARCEIDIAKAMPATPSVGDVANAKEITQ